MGSLVETDHSISHMVNTMAVDDLAMQGGKTSEGTALTYFGQNTTSRVIRVNQWKW